MDYNSFFTFSTIGGYIELSQSNEYLFTDTLSNDILIHTDFSNQNILIGTDSNKTSAVHISDIEIAINRNMFLASNFSIGIRDYSERFVVGNGNVKFHDNLYVMKQMGIGTSNLTHMLTMLGPSNSVLGPHLSAYYDESSNPVFQLYNENRDDIQLNFDCYNDGNGDLLSTSDTGNFQIRKVDGRLQFTSACNSVTGTNITNNLYPALTINSNSYIGIATRDATHRITVRAEDSNRLGPHSAYYVNSDSNYPLFQQVNMTHDYIEQNYDAIYDFDTSNWKSSSSKANFSVQKKNGRYTIFNSCNILPGEVVNWTPAFTVNSNSYIGIGTSNPRHRLTIQGPSNDTLGPHIAAYLHDSNNPVLQIHSCNNDLMSINFNCWWNNLNWISSQSNANFQIIKSDGKLMINSAEFVERDDSVDSSWYPAFTVGSNSYIGVRNSNPQYPLDVEGQTIFRSNVYMTGHILPNSNVDYDLGSSNYRFRDLYLSGNSIDMERLILSKDILSGGLNVFDGVTNRPTRVWAREMLLGDPYDLIDSNVYLVTASSNGLQLTLVQDLDIPLQDFSQLNKLYVTQTHLGIGLSNPEKWLHMIGDLEINPSVAMNLNWDNSVLRMEVSDLLLKEDQKITKWINFSASNENAPTLMTRNGYCDGSFIRFRDQESLASDAPLEVLATSWFGLTISAMVRFSGSPTSDDAVILFESATSKLIMKRDSADPTRLLFETNEISLLSPPGTLKQNEWALYTIRFQEDLGVIKMYKNLVEIVSEPLAIIDDMYFDAGPTSSIAKGNVDIQCIYLFDRPIFDDELLNLKRMILYTSRQTHKVRTDVMLYPPPDFRDDEVGWVVEEDSVSKELFKYSKQVTNSYYGNGTYKIWTNDEDFTTGVNQSYLVYDPRMATYWSSFRNFTTNSTNQQDPATLYFELPQPIVIQSYLIGSQNIDATTSPSKWNLYGSTNMQTWVLVDAQTGVDNWALSQEKIFVINCTDPYKYFRLDVLQNSSFTPKQVTIGSFKFYGMEHMFYLDGNGLGVGTSLVKERLHVDGGALITQNLTVGLSTTDELMTCKALPPRKLVSSITYLSGLKFGNGEYNVNQSAYYQNDGAYIGYKVFDQDDSTYWVGEDGAYNDIGEYISTTPYSTEMSGTTRFGDWLQIQLPMAVCLKSYAITVSSVDPEITGPTTFYIAGSDDGNTWTQLDKKDWSWSIGDIDATFNVNYNVYTTYSYYRLVVTRVGTNSLSSPSSLTIADWVLYGDMIDRSTSDEGSMVIKGEMKVSSGVNLTSKNTMNETTLHASTKTLAKKYDNMSLIHWWNSFSQTKIKSQPTFYSEGGYRNTPFLRFNKKTMSTSKKRLNISTNGGFTLVCQVKFNANNAISLNDSIFTVYRGNMSHMILSLSRDVTKKILCSVETGSLAPESTMSTDVFENNNWFTIAARYIVGTNRLELYNNNTLIKVETLSQLMVDDFAEICVIGDAYTDMDMSFLYVWDKPLTDAELFEACDILIQGTQSLYVEKSVRVPSGIEGGLVVYGQSNTMTYSVFPPNTLEGNQSLCKNNPSGNGTYVVSASMSYSPSYEPYNVFNPDTTFYWKGEAGAFSGVTGSYFGEKGNTYEGSSVYNAEWIQIQMPQDIVLREYIIKPTANYTTSAPRAWTMFGSKNGIDWVQIHSVGNATWSGVDDQYFVTNATIEYNYYRLAVSIIYTDGSTHSSVEIEKLELWGKSRESFSVQDGRVVVFDKLGVNNTNPSASLHVSGFSILSGLKIVAVEDYNYQLPSYSQPISGGGGGGGGGGGESIWTGNSLGVFVESNVGIKRPPDTTRTLSVLGTIGLYNSTGVSTLYSSGNNFGINTPNPTYTLQVNGTTQLAGNLLVNNSATIKGLRIRKTTGSLPNLSTAVAGIGMSNDNLGMTLTINDNTSANYIKFQADGNEMARFTGEGYFGIGTTTPSHLLELGLDSAAKPSSATWTVTSDQRLKTNITSANIDRCYEIVKQLPLRRYTWLSNVYDETVVKDRTKLGWIAQEVEKVFPKAVETKQMLGLEDCKTLNSDQLYAVVYGSVQKLQFIVEDIKKENKLLGDRMSKIESKVNNIPVFKKQMELFSEEVEKLKAENIYLKEIIMKIIKKVGAI